MQDETQTGEQATTPSIVIAGAWALVMVPWAWGLISTLEKALLLFN